MNKQWCLTILIVLIGACSANAQVIFPQQSVPPDSTVVQQLLAIAPQQILNYSQEFLPEVDEVHANYLVADLDGSGSFKFVVAFYYLDGDAEGYLAVGRMQDNKMSLLFVNNELLGGATATIELIDANGDGIPEIEVEGTGPSGHTRNTELMRWTGSELASLIPKDIDSIQVEFYDLNGDGKLEMIGSPYFMPPVDAQNDRIGDYEIYELENDIYKLASQSSTNPILSVDSEGNINIVKTPGLQLSPSQFPISQVGVNAQSTTSDSTPVHLFIRKLVGKGQVEVPLDQLDPSSIWLDPGIHPIQTQIVPDAESSTAGAVMLDIFLPRATLLKRLQWLQPTAPLAVGDSIDLSFHARVKDGRTVTGGVSAKIVGDSTQ